MRTGEQQKLRLFSRGGVIAIDAACDTAPRYLGRQPIAVLERVNYICAQVSIILDMTGLPSVRSATCWPAYSTCACSW